MQPQVHVKAFFDEPTSTVTYLVSDPATRQAAVIDPVLGYDHRNGKVSTAMADGVLAAAHQADISIAWVLETHVHADHLSAAPYIRQRTGARVAIGEKVRLSQRHIRLDEGCRRRHAVHAGPPVVGVAPHSAGKTMSPSAFCPCPSAPWHSAQFCLNTRSPRR